MKHEVDRPDYDISYEHLPQVPQNVPQKEKVQRNGRGYDRPDRRAEALDAVPEEADETSDRERCEDVRFLVDQIHAQSPGERGEEDRNVEQNGRGQSVRHVFPLSPIVGAGLGMYQYTEQLGRGLL